MIEMDESYIDNLCNQKIVNETFFPIKEKFNSLKEDVEEIELLFKNCWYNFNGLMKRVKEIEESIRLNPKIKETLQQYKEYVPKEVMRFSNMTIWEDIIIFEFHAFLTNIMRTINFLIKFNLKNKEKRILESYPPIRKFVENKNNENIYYYSEIKKEFSEWISKVNDNRDDITHKWVKKRMRGTFSVISNWDNLGKINLTKNITAGILEHDIEDLEKYCQDKLDKLKKFIEQYFKNL